MYSNLKTDSSDKKILERYSSAFTLSDMEIFIFPELFYPLVLANIMSPIIWKWREDPWFKDIDKKNFTYKTNRIKQYIIQNYVFNLDLSTWGLTSKNRELERFAKFFNTELLKQSNALFGYEGDKYYFDIDIRKHFGLDKYDSDIIPYWKTETVEAMTAFKFKENFSSGAGECVSLSALYTAAMFVVGRVPLEKIFLIATPLHSQNFIIENNGLITNNRRIVTKNMWFNGTALSSKARRAMENEKVTIVSHISGYIHLIYDEATIDRKAYELFSLRLREFLVTELTDTNFINFLRFKPKYKSLFQYRCEFPEKERYISLEKMFEYEHTSKFGVSCETRGLLVKEIEEDEFHLSPIHGKIMLNDIEEILSKSKGKSLEEIENDVIRNTEARFKNFIHEMFIDLAGFIKTDPRLPDHEKNYVSTIVPIIDIEDNRDSIIRKIHSMSDRSELSRLALYVYREMDVISWLPFVKAAMERNPVCFNDLNGKSTEDVFNILHDMPDNSIYDSNRLAQPDEVWNFRRGDGIEKALLLADFIMQKNSTGKVAVEIENSRVRVTSEGKEYLFISHKNIEKSIRISGRNYEIT